MIVGFRHRGLERFFTKGDGRRLPPALRARIGTILLTLSEAATIEELNLPTYRLHPLRGELRGAWAITVRANWRIVFRFDDGKVFDVDFLDYH
jgi:proteic killer suppression protein